MEISRRYATASHIYIPILKRAVQDFAVSADWTPTAGDVKISIDGGAFANVTNLPTATNSANTGAMWDFSLTAGELTGKKMIIIVSDAATKAVEDQCILIATYGHPSAERAIETDIVSVGLLSAGAAGSFTLNGSNIANVAVGDALYIPGKGSRIIATYNTGTGAGTTASNGDSAFATSDPYVVYKLPKAEPLTGADFSGNIPASVEAVNGVTIVGDGAGTPFNV